MLVNFALHLGMQNNLTVIALDSPCSHIVSLFLPPSLNAQTVTEQ
jgi:hypothetical protein